MSFFSYKGGAGRSTLALNVIPFLANALGADQDHPLIVVDMDIDSCGLTFLYNLHHNLDENFNVQAMFGEHGHIPVSNQSATNHNLFRNLMPIGGVYNKGDRDILCLPAYPGNSLNGSSNYDSPMELCQKFVEECEKVGCCGIVFDSAVGDQLTARWSNDLADCIICCMRPTKQFRDGTNRYFDETFDETMFGKNVIVVPNVVPTDALTLPADGELRQYPDYAKEEILRSFQDNIDAGNNTYIMDMVDGEIFGVPKIDRFMWQEGILDNLAKDELTDCEKLALRQYEKIAKLVADL